MQILFVRHGQSTANTLQIFANRDEDRYPLTPLGQRQANDLASRVRSEPIAHVYTSPLLRARQTAAAVATPRALTLQTAPALREYDVGEFEGRPYGGSHVWRMERYQENEACWRQGEAHHRLAGGESLDDVQERLHAFIRSLLLRHAPSESVLLVGHGGLFRVALPVLLENVTFEFSHRHPMDHATIVRTTVTDGRLVCMRWGDGHTRATRA